MMQPKRTMTMNWDGFGDEDDDFFDSNNRISAVVPIDFDDLSSGSDDEFEDPRMSFAEGARLSSVEAPPRISSAGGPLENYDLWIAAPTSINERRRKLLNGMGLNSSKELLRIRTLAMSKKHGNVSMKAKRASGAAPPLPPSGLPKTTTSSSSATRSSSKKMKDDVEQNNNEGHNPKREEDRHNNDISSNDNPTTTNNNDDTTTTTTTDNNNVNDNPESQLRDEDDDVDSVLFVRSRSDSDIQYFSVDNKRRKEELLGKTSKQKLTRTLSHSAPCTCVCKLNYTVETNGNAKPRIRKKRRSNNSGAPVSQNNQPSSATGQLTAFFLIKNLDTGKEFIVKEFAEDGMWNRLSDLQTGKQLTMEEFEKSVGHSRLVKELMRREKGGRGHERKNSVNALLSKSFRYSKKKSQSLIKTMSKKVSHSSTGTSGLNVDHQKENQHTTTSTSADQLPPKGGAKTSTSPSPSNNNPEWVKVRMQGKNQKELSALRFCQEIKAHEGSIWTLKFNFDGRYLASAGEDKLIHVWEVQECEIGTEEGGSTPMFSSSPDHAFEKKGKSTSRKEGMIPEHVQLPENVFSLSNEPICSFEGHLDDVLDLSWSSSQLLLLSSSMDKTVRLWDLEKKACLKLFSHNDYVTCIQFNPMNDDYFISGSLDTKVRLWNVSGRRVVDWTDLQEMVTATCYTSDGQCVAIGSHKGNCRIYSIADGKLSEKSQFDIPTKNKTTPKKITGFEFNAEKPSEVLVTSADSRVRIYDGIDVVQKFRGFRNMNSQIAASFSPDGKYVISASEDSNIYLWKRQEHKNAKTKTTIDTSAHENFQCKDVSVAIPWPGGTRSTQLHNKNATKDATNKKQLPPLPNGKKSGNTTENDNDNNNEDAEESSASNSNLSPSPSKSASRKGGSNVSDTTQATACGLVIVTAGLGGEIRAYQNFGLPLKVGTSLF